MYVAICIVHTFYNIKYVYIYWIIGNNDQNLPYVFYYSMC